MAEIAGLKLIVPSSVAGSGVSVSASGKVSFTAATSVSVNGCFSSTYDNYLIVIQGIASSSTVSIRGRLRLSGTDASGTDYARQYLDVDNTSVTGARSTSQTEANTCAISSTARSGAHIYIYGPYLAQPTALRGVTASGQNSAQITDHASTHSLSTSYDGITLFPSSNNITGSLTIYGLSQ